MPRQDSDLVTEATDAPRVSVLLPVWNAETTLPACLASLQRQTEPDWECILIDDGSEDRSLELARTVASRDGRLRIVARDHEGLVPTLNHGLTLCRAPIVARMDADDWMHRDRLRLQSQALEADVERDAYGTWPRLFPRRVLRDGRRRYEAWLHSMTDADRVWRDRFIECPIAHPTLAIRRATLVELGYRDRGWPEDYDLILRLLRRGPRVGVLPRRLVGWREHPGRLSRNDERYTLDRFTACRAWHLHRDYLAGTSEYILWGHGRTGRSLRRELEGLGHRPTAIVEVHPRRIGETIHGAPVIGPESLPDQPALPIIVSVSGAGPRAEIRAALEGMGIREGVRFVCAA